MSTLPNELLLHILQNVSTADLTTARLVDRRLSHAATSLRSTRERRRYTLRIAMDEDSGQLYVRMQRRWKSGGEKEALPLFDVHIFHLVDVDVIEIEGLTEKTGSVDAIDFVNRALEISSAFNTVSELRFTSVTLPDTAKFNLIKFFKAIIPQCSHIFVRDCLLPVAIPADTIEFSDRLRTFKWSQSFANEDEQAMNEAALRRIGARLTLECTAVELTDAPTEGIVHLFQKWMALDRPTLFSLIVLNRTPEWQANLLHHCTHAGFRNFMGEFEHPGAGCAHIKVISGRDSCQLLPVLDVPAKTPQMPVVMARWFRDR